MEGPGRHEALPRRGLPEHPPGGRAGGPAPPGEAARARALAAAEKLGYPAAEYAVVDVGTETRPKRVDTTVVLEAKPPGIGEARPRLTAVFHGPRLAFFLPTIRVPEEFLRAERRRTSVDWILLGARVVAAGALVGLGIILFLRSVRRPEFEWREVRTPLLWTAALAILGLANTAPAALRHYQTETPFGLFRLGLGVSLAVGLAVMLLVALIGFVLLSAARPGWAASLRRRGSLGDAFLRASIAAAGLLGLLRWVHLLSNRSATVYEPDPNLPSSLPFPVPAVDVLWTAARGTSSSRCWAPWRPWRCAPISFALRSGGRWGLSRSWSRSRRRACARPGSPPPNSWPGPVHRLDRGFGRAPAPRARSGMGLVRHLHRRRPGGHRLARTAGIGRPGGGMAGSVAPGRAPRRCSPDASRAGCVARARRRRWSRRSPEGSAPTIPWSGSACTPSLQTKSAIDRVIAATTGTAQNSGGARSAAGTDRREERAKANGITKDSAKRIHPS